jgi:hypothetical protein
MLNITRNEMIDLVNEYAPTLETIEPQDVINHLDEILEQLSGDSDD